MQVKMLFLMNPRLRQAQIQWESILKYETRKNNSNNEIVTNRRRSNITRIILKLGRKNTLLQLIFYLNHRRPQLAINGHILSQLKKRHILPNTSPEYVFGLILPFRRSTIFNLTLPHRGVWAPTHHMFEPFQPHFPYLILHGGASPSVEYLHSWPYLS